MAKVIYPETCWDNQDNGTVFWKEGKLNDFPNAKNGIFESWKYNFDAGKQVFRAEDEQGHGEIYEKRLVADANGMPVWTGWMKIPSGEARGIQAIAINDRPLQLPNTEGAIKLQITPQMINTFTKEEIYDLVGKKVQENLDEIYNYVAWRVDPNTNKPVDPTAYPSLEDAAKRVLDIAFPDGGEEEKFYLVEPHPGTEGLNEEATWWVWAVDQEPPYRGYWVSVNQVNMRMFVSYPVLWEHTNDKVFHITAAERAKWDGIIDDLAVFKSTNTFQHDAIQNLIRTYTLEPVFTDNFLTSVKLVDNKGNAISTVSLTNVEISKLNVLTQFKLYGYDVQNPNEVKGKVGKYVLEFDTDVPNKLTWQPKIVAPTMVTVTFNVDGGTVLNPLTVTEGSTILEPVTTKENFSFDGWYTNTQKTTPFNFNTPITADITLYAKFTQITHEVTFNINGGSAIAKQTVNQGAKAIKPVNDPTKLGYTFDGYWTSAAFTNLYNWDTIITESIEIYVKYNINQYTLTFNVDGGNTVNAITQDYNTTLATLPNTTKDGFEFDGWFDGTIKITSYLFTANKTLTAKCTQITYQVTFNLAGGTGTFSAQTVNWGAKATEPSNSPSRDDHTFGGWDFDFDTLIYMDTVVTAKWDEIAKDKLFWGMLLPAGSDPDDYDIKPFTTEELLQKIDSFNLLETSGKTNKDNTIFQGFGWITFISPVKFGEVQILNEMNTPVYPGTSWNKYNVTIDGEQYNVYQSISENLGDKYVYHFKFN